MKTLTKDCPFLQGMTSSGIPSPRPSMPLPFCTRYAGIQRRWLWPLRALKGSIRANTTCCALEATASSVHGHVHSLHEWILVDSGCLQWQTCSGCLPGLFMLLVILTGWTVRVLWTVLIRCSPIPLTFFRPHVFEVFAPPNS